MEKIENSRFDHLLQQYIGGMATAAELNEFSALLQQYSLEEEQLVALEDALNKTPSLEGVDEALITQMFSHITGADTNEDELQVIGQRPVHRVHFLKRWGWAAASILLLLAAGTYFLWFQQERLSDTALTDHNISAIAPGKDGAILTLSDGSKLVLDSLGNGVVATQNGAAVVMNNGSLSYTANGKKNSEITYNTMSTPRGRQFHMQLPDGTQVWLNAASSIRYPTAFTGKDRSVEVTGEAYFEVVSNPVKPFKVIVARQAGIEVLGTSFNINAYQEEKKLNITLLQGSVKVGAISLSAKPSSGALLKPGQQAQLANRQSMGEATTVSVINNTDLSKVMAWKNGMFNFEGASFEEIMHQLERWYDIEVVYEKGIPAIEFGGELNRDISLNSLLLALEESKVHLRLEGRKLIVLQ